MNFDNVLIGALIAAAAAISVPFISKLISKSKETLSSKSIIEKNSKNNSINVEGDKNTVITNSNVNVSSNENNNKFNKLSDTAKQRQQELENKGYRGSTNAEIHNLNVLENRNKSDEELMRIVEEKEKIHGYGWAKKARAELRRRGYNY